ncbi:hypothetical protein E2562_010616 [Oryza meyeriana var. granulata]|uniref:DUF834 domain-containing protein n=1 Tax=Oryza meyeriana var. granulata TaxID=110450 RepID=A0A6G1BUW8_9ORYZ|nr:hypothetical protein E2562_010616 [Oryza meyeriana var. granulata]
MAPGRRSFDPGDVAAQSEGSSTGVANRGRGEVVGAISHRAAAGKRCYRARGRGAVEAGRRRRRVRGCHTGSVRFPGWRDVTGSLLLLALGLPEVCSGRPRELRRGMDGEVGESAGAGGCKMRRLSVEQRKLSLGVVMPGLGFLDLGTARSELRLAAGREEEGGGGGEWIAAGRIPFYRRVGGVVGCGRGGRVDLVASGAPRRPSSF